MLFFILFFIQIINANLYGKDCGIDYCLECSNDKSSCLKCIEYYDIDIKGKCIPKTYYNSKSFLICDTGYAYNKETGKCELKNKGCTSFSATNATKCNRCISTLALVNGACKECTNLPGCISISGTCTKCLACKTGYYLQNNECVLDQYMKSTGFCVMGYIYDSTQKKCVKGIDDCITHINKTICAVCANGKFVGTDGKCKSVSVENCIEALNETHCKQCAAGLGWDKTQKKCVTCTNTQCELCGETKTCTKCKDGKQAFTYQKSVNNGPWFSTTECHALPENCLKLGGMINPSGCEICATGYYYNGKNCEKCSFDACTKIDTSTQAKKVDNYLTCAEFCKDGDKTKIPNDDTCFANTYTVGSSKKEVCRMCQLGFYMTKDYTCQKCDESTMGYCREYSQNKFCVSFYQDGCTMYSADGCSCVECDVNYNLVNGKCVQKQYGCSAYGGNDQCVECFATYIGATYLPTNGKCTTPPSAGTSECPQGYTKNAQKQCIITCSNSLVPNNENNACVCANGKVLGLDGKCIDSCEASKNSVLNKQKTHCVCDAGYAQQNNQCVKCDSAKHKMVSDDGKSCVCEGSYKEQNGECVKQVDPPAPPKPSPNNGSISLFLSIALIFLMMF